MSKFKNLFIRLGLATSLILVGGFANASDSTKLADIIAGDHRTPEFAARDQFRHPLETLTFLGINDKMTVVEISPGGGWYTEILAPYLKDNGLYIAAGYDPDSSSEYYAKNAKKFADKLAQNPALYGKTKLSIMQPPEKLDFAAENSVDLILSFRNTHNWHSKGQSEQVYSAIYKALKPGGTFGLVQHRASETKPQDTSGKLGYLKQSEIIQLAEKVGLKLVAQSEINANPKDTKDHPGGVWNLAPVFSDKENSKEKYQAIGESDRMTLKFTKPAIK